MASDEKSVEQAALSYLSRGWSVVPIRRRDKRPAIRWQGYQHRRATPDEVRAWFRQWPGANVAIVTGAVSGIIVLDVDPQHGGDASLRRLEARHGPLPPTLEAMTGGGGRHIYFAHPGGVVYNKVGLLPGIDLRGDGGYVVAPPSLHASGVRYAWASQATAPDPLPRWLLQRVSSRGRGGHRLSYWRKLVHEGIMEGERNNTIASLAGRLLWHGVDEDVVLDLLLCWNATRCRPPLPEDEVARTVESIRRLHGRRIT